MRTAGRRREDEGAPGPVAGESSTHGGEGCCGSQCRGLCGTHCGCRGLGVFLRLAPSVVVVGLTLDLAVRLRSDLAIAGTGVAMRPLDAPRE